MLWLLSAALALPPHLADAVALGDCDPLHAAIATPSTDEERVVVALCLREVDPARADALLAPVSAGVLGDYARLVHAEGLLQAGRPEEALARAEGLGLPGEAGLRARLLRGRALIQVHRSLDARPDLQALLETSVKDEARFWLATGALDRGDTTAGVAALRRTWADSTRGGWSEQAAAMLAGLNLPVPELGTAEGRALVRERIVALREAQRHAEALELLLAVRKVEGVTAPDDALGRAYFNARRYPDAVATWTALYSSSGGPSALFDLALAKSRTGDHDGAAAVYRRLMAAHPSSEQADHASYKLGFLEFDRGDCRVAIQRFTEHLQRWPDSADLESALWFSGWCAWKLGEPDEAERWWQKLAERRPTSAMVPGAAYWRARRLGLEGFPDAERAAMLDLLRRWPKSGHAWFAALRTGTTFASKPLVERPPLPAAIASLPAARRAEALLSAGLRGWAAVEARALIGPAKAAGRDASLAVAWLLIAADAFADGKALAAPYCDVGPVGAQACWPRAEGGIVARAAERYGLEPLLPYAIMLAESNLVPGVTSAAGARGLMQIMPAEGDRLHAEALGSGLFSGDRLYLAPYNALLGTTELGLKWRSLEGAVRPAHLPAVIASYNAGEEAVRRWVAASPTAEVDTFAEDIPYTETRRYVRTVLGNLMAWRQVYGDGGS